MSLGVEQSLYPMDLVEQGLVNPNHLTPDQLYGGVIATDTWASHVHAAEDGRVHLYTLGNHHIPAGWRQAPPGLILNIWHMRGDEPAIIFRKYVASEGGVRILQRDQNGTLPQDVTDRMEAEAASYAKTQAQRHATPQPATTQLLRFGNAYYDTPVAAAAAGVALMRERAMERANKGSTFLKTVKGLAHAAFVKLGIARPAAVGRHHRPVGAHRLVYS